MFVKYRRKQVENRNILSREVMTINTFEIHVKLYDKVRSLFRVKV